MSKEKHMLKEHQDKINTLYKDYPEIPYISEDRDLEQWFKKLTLKTESLVPKRNMVRSSENLLAGDIILLWRISLGTYTTESWTPKYFEYDYGISCEASLESLLNEGFAYQFTAKDSLQFVPATVLKVILKNAGIKGLSKLTKEQLVSTTQQHFTEEDLAKLIDIRGYGLTEKGQAALDNNPEIIDRHPKKNL